MVRFEKEEILKITAVLVAYNCKIEETKTLVSILQNYKNDPKDFEVFKLIIYDNSASSQKSNLSLPFDWEYLHDPTNRGIAVAYNYALDKAVKSSSDWLLLLDQDSSLPEDFVKILFDNVLKLKDNASIAAIVPEMCYKGKLFSPSKVLFGGVHRPINRFHIGPSVREIFAVGSCSLIKVSFLTNIGGFNRFFWLDCLDRWLFYKIYKLGYRVFVLNMSVEHELSVLDYDLFMNEQRYWNIMIYETHFMKSYKSKIEIYVYYLRLLMRTLNLLFFTKHKKYSSITFRHLMRIALPFASFEIGTNDN